jgi:hypothetical protein
MQEPTSLLVARSDATIDTAAAVSLQHPGFAPEGAAAMRVRIKIEVKSKNFP